MAYSKSDKNTLQEYFQRKALPLPKYNTFTTGGQAHTPIWISDVVIYINNQQKVSIRGKEGSNKIKAELSAAFRALTYLKLIKQRTRTRTRVSAPSAPRNSGFGFGELNTSDDSSYDSNSTAAIKNDISPIFYDDGKRELKSYVESYKVFNSSNPSRSHYIAIIDPTSDKKSSNLPRRNQNSFNSSPMLPPPHNDSNVSFYHDKSKNSNHSNHSVAIIDPTTYNPLPSNNLPFRNQNSFNSPSLSKNSNSTPNSNSNSNNLTKNKNKNILVAIDVENVPNALSNLLREIPKNVEINNNFNLSIICVISEDHHTKNKLNLKDPRVKLIEAPTTRPNGADIAIALYIGYILFEDKYDSYYAISRDNFAGAMTDCIEDFDKVCGRVEGRKKEAYHCRTVSRLIKHLKIK